jgi:hypothetical protein
MKGRQAARYGERERPEPSRSPYRAGDRAIFLYTRSQTELRLVFRGGADVARPRTNEPSVRILLNRVSDPTHGAAE